MTITNIFLSPGEPFPTYIQCISINHSWQRILTWIQSQAVLWVFSAWNLCPQVFRDGEEDWRLHLQLNSVRVQWLLCSVCQTFSWIVTINIPLHGNLTNDQWPCVWLFGNSCICYLVMFSPQLGQTKRLTLLWHSLICRFRLNWWLVSWRRNKLNLIEFVDPIWIGGWLLRAKRPALQNACTNKLNGNTCKKRDLNNSAKTTSKAVYC